MTTNQSIRSLDATADVVVSTCVLRLMAKRGVYADAFAVLSPGGNLSISDVVILRAVRDAPANEAEAHAARLEAAAHAHRLCSMMCDLGFVDVRVDIEVRLEDVGQCTVSTYVTATKPGARAVVGAPAITVTAS